MGDQLDTNSTLVTQSPGGHPVKCLGGPASTSSRAVQPVEGFGATVLDVEPDAYLADASIGRQNRDRESRDTPRPLVEARRIHSAADCSSTNATIIVNRGKSGSWHAAATAEASANRNGRNRMLPPARGGSGGAGRGRSR
jgi:hypothetical protein